MAFKMKNTAYYKKKMAESEIASPHKMHSHLKEYIPQSQRVMNQYEPQTEMDWNDPSRKKLDHYVTEESTTSSGDLLNNPPPPPPTPTPTPTPQPNANTDLPSASSNRPNVTTNTPTEIDTSDIDARWARKNARREYRQAARQSRRDARQKRKMDRINNRTERREARRERRADRKADRPTKFYSTIGGDIWKKKRGGGSRRAIKLFGRHI